MSKINRVPYGVQDLLGNTAAGENPDELLQDVRPTFDMTPYWGFEKIEWEEKDSNVSLPTQGGFYLIPQGELWIPITMGATISGAVAGSTIALSVRVFEVSGANSIPVAFTGLRTIVDTADTVTVGFVWPQKVLYRAGQIFGVVCDEFSTGATLSLQSAIQYYKLTD